MKNRHLRNILIWGTFILTCMVAIQVYWFTRAFDVAEKQFDHRVQMALRRVADSISSRPEIKKLSSDFFYVDTRASLQNERLDSLLRKEFAFRNVNTVYELGIYKAADDTILYGNYIQGLKSRSLPQAESAVGGYGGEKNFAVYFPNRKSYIAAQLTIWIFSTFMLLLMAGFFAYAIASLLRERRFAELKNDFINNMTHEFKTPVTNINIAAEILRQKFGNQHGSQIYLDILLKENEKLRLKIDQVLLGATIEQRKRPAFTAVDVHDLIKECADAFFLRIHERHGVLNLELNSENQLIMGDREMLAQAINNIIDNSEKYSLHPPYITVTTRDRGNDIEIIISDKGIGIEEKATTKIFDKFFRVSTGNVHRVKGFGLGLSFVKSAVRIHRGYIRLFSKLNQGTEVMISLPKA